MNKNEILYKEYIRLIKTINKVLNCNGNQISTFLQFLSKILVVYTVKLYKSVR